MSSFDFCTERVDLRAFGAEVNRICTAKVNHICAKGAKVNRVCSTILLLEKPKDIETVRSISVSKTFAVRRCFTLIQWMISLSLK